MEMGVVMLAGGDGGSAAGGGRGSDAASGGSAAGGGRGSAAASGGSAAGGGRGSDAVVTGVVLLPVVVGVVLLVMTGVVLRGFLNSWWCLHEEERCWRMYFLFIFSSDPSLPSSPLRCTCGK